MPKPKMSSLGVVACGEAVTYKRSDHMGSKCLDMVIAETSAPFARCLSKPIAIVFSSHKDVGTSGPNFFG